jgi:integrase/recombinase XerD
MASRGCLPEPSHDVCHRCQVSMRIWWPVVTRRCGRIRFLVAFRLEGKVGEFVRVPRTLPKILSPGEVDALIGALRTHRDRAMVFAMVLGGLRRCEVLGLRLPDVRVADRSLFVAEGKGGHQRVVPISNLFFREVGDYLHEERPGDASSDRLFVTLKGPSRGQGLSAQGVETIMLSARARAGLERATCHQLRHTCLTRLREAGMALEAVQAQAGHRSIESTRIYLHLTNDWLASEYRRAADLIDAGHAAELLAIEELAQ